MKTCSICQRTSNKANQRSHSKIATIRRQKVNLQSKSIDGKRQLICTSCLRGRSKDKK
ncbi:50S ribosomal protein L28 [bacterium]|nr:50S ribosomal protein L28 [bacterium]